MREKLRLMLVAGSREAAPRSVAELAEAAFAGGATALQLSIHVWESMTKLLNGMRKT